MDHGNLTAPLFVDLSKAFEHMEFLEMKKHGLQLDPSLNMQEHFNSICRKASSRISLLKRIRPFITDLATLRIYQVLVVPIITYCSLTNFYYQPYRKSSILALKSRVCKLTNKDIPSVNKIL